ncbi:DUF3231 family protein [Sporomusa aerivorans]|uniref:DUF3231 family protein n=1 Tax=Sporomusa aerivorans TaxID=204936 RepID=UPI00352B2E1B
MTIIDQVKAYTRTILQSIFDKEPVNYMEASSLYGLILQARHNISLLSSFYNQASDPELRDLIKTAIYQHAVPTIENCEKLLREGGAELPDTHFPSHPLYDKTNYPKGVQLTDMEIAIAVGNLARSSQLILFLSLQQCYQPEILLAISSLMSNGLQWDYQLLQLMLHRGWLPNAPKVQQPTLH